jgi:2-oxoglutarate dehydrogenase E1 component
MSRQQAAVESATAREERERVMDAYRRWGYLQANLDPLGDLKPEAVPELDVTGAEAAAARKIYCVSIGAEFMHIPNGARRRWVQERMESKPPEVNRPQILERLVRAEIFEQVLQTRYLGTKRYSLEGEAALLPLLDSILNAAAEMGAEQAMLAMSHRGRLNVMVHVVGRAAAEVSHGSDRRFCCGEWKEN